MEIEPGDLVIISASPIPGNENQYSRSSTSCQEGCDVIYESLADVHCRATPAGELNCTQLVRPKFFMPIHGEYRYLKQHANLAAKMGMPHENIFMMEIGQVLELTSDSAKISGNVTSGRILVDGLVVVDVGSIVLRDRKLLSQDGLIVVVITTEKESGQVIAGPDIISRGFVYVRESEDLMEEAREIIKKTLSKLDGKKANDWAARKSVIKNDLREYLYEKTKRKPMILPIIMEI